MKTEDYLHGLEKDDVAVRLAYYFSEVNALHPFREENGRMSRLLTTLLLYRCGYVVGRYISLESKIEKTKENYYDVLEQCGTHWHENGNDPSPFIKYLLGIVLAAYRDFETRISFVDEKLPAIEMVRKAVHEKIGKFTKSEIMELVPSLSKASVENSLTLLMEQGIVDSMVKGRRHSIQGQMCRKIMSPFFGHN